MVGGAVNRETIESNLRLASLTDILSRRHAAQRELLRPQLFQSSFRFLELFAIVRVRCDFAIKLHRPSAVERVTVVKAGGAQARIMRRVAVPLKAALKVGGGPAIHAIGLLLVD